MQATGRCPASARPIAVPTIVDSDKEELTTRPGNTVLNPLVMPNTSPFGSSMSWPRMKILLSAARLSYKAPLMADRIVLRSSCRRPRDKLSSVMKGGRVALSPRSVASPVSALALARASCTSVWQSRLRSSNSSPLSPCSVRNR